MNWTFGIITSGNRDEDVLNIVRSIRKQNIKKYEIIVVGNSNLIGDDIKVIKFDDTLKVKPWISRKKNIIAEHANYDLLSIHHDYVCLGDNWYNNFINFGEDWDVCMTRIETKEGKRFRDWMVWDDEKPHENDTNKGKVQYLSYEESNRTKEQYISGSYFCVKKSYFLSNKLDEKLCWGDSEDVEWSLRLRNSWNLKLNKNSKVILSKTKVIYPRYNPFEK